MLLRGRILLPITAPPVEDGAVLISGERILEAGPWSELRARTDEPAVDLGDVAIFPGLINAHCHLDYTHFAGCLPPPRTFTDWIQGVLGLKAQWGYSEYAASWLTGARQLLAAGCTTVCDIEAVPELLPDSWTSTPLRIVSAIEMTGIRAARDPADILAQTLARIERLPHPRNIAAFAPHAPYSTRPELLALTAREAKARRLPVTIHAAESLDEFNMFRHARGPMHDWLRVQRDMSDCGRGTPIRAVAETGLLDFHCLVAHANYLEDDDLSLLLRPGISVVHCPRSHAYFKHAEFRLRDLRRAGVNVCLGTDSLLTVRCAGRCKPRLELPAELAAAEQAFPDLAPMELVQLVTTAGAMALGRKGELGELSPGAMADLVAITYSGALDQAASALVHHTGPVVASLIGGQWVIPPSR
jgi:cytosine/adenosine deaminase-related metal-dependent hydrolase